MIFTEKQVKSLKKLYPKFGLKKSAEILGFTEKQIQRKVNYLKLYLSKPYLKKLNKTKYKNIIKIKQLKKQNIISQIDWDNYLDINNEFIAYILGLIWADGTLDKKGVNTFYPSLSLEENDGKEVFDILCKYNFVKPWAIHFYKPQNPKWKNESKINNYDWKLGYFLFLHNYHIKSKVPPLKIWNKLNEDGKIYFLLGFFDGDGSINVNKSRIAVSFHSGYYQDWGFLKNYFNILNIKYRINKEIRSTGKSSSFIISKRIDAYNFMKFLYNHSKECIGLNRKFQELIKFEDYVRTRPLLLKKYQFPVINPLVSERIAF